MRKIIFLLTVTCVLGATSVFAIQGKSNVLEKNNQNIASTNSSSSKEGLNSKDGMLKRIEEKTQMSQQEFEQNRAEVKNLMEQNRIEFRNWLENQRQEMKAKIEAKKNELEAKLQKITTERKQKITERIYDRINALNERMTDHYLDVLEKLEKILERVESRTAKAKANGKDVSEVEILISQAKDVIARAREEVKNQTQKIYQIELSNENNLKLDTGNARQKLHDDLKTVEKIVKEARESVRLVIVKLAQIPKVDELEISTSSQSNQ